MFLHLGGEVVVPLKEVITILDLETCKESTITNEFLKIVDEEGFTKDIADNKPKSCIITTRNVYLSPISSLTLAKRALTNYGLLEDMGDEE
jgi:hypothetical protein